MATGVAPPEQLKMTDYKGKVDPDWCPGCGDFGVLSARSESLGRPADSETTMW